MWIRGEMIVAMTMGAWCREVCSFGLRASRRRFTSVIWQGLVKIVLRMRLRNSTRWRKCWSLLKDLLFFSISASTSTSNLASPHLSPKVSVSIPIAFHRHGFRGMVTCSFDRQIVSSLCHYFVIPSYFYTHPAKAYFYQILTTSGNSFIFVLFTFH